MGRIVRTAAYAAAGGLLFTGLGYSADHFMFNEGVGRGTDSYLPDYDIDGGDDAREAAAELEVLLHEAQQDARRVHAGIGESCVSFLRYYLPTEYSGGYGQDLAVEDGIRDPKKPCGESRHDIRVDYDNLAMSSEDLSDANFAVSEAQDAVAYYEKAQRDDDNFSGARRGLVAGGLVGFLRRERLSTARRIEYETELAGE